MNGSSPQVSIIIFEAFSRSGRLELWLQDRRESDYSEGQGDLVTRLIMGKIGVTIFVIGVIKSYLLSLPDRPSTLRKTTASSSTINTCPAGLAVSVQGLGL